MRNVNKDEGNDMENLMSQLSQMLKNQDIPKKKKNMVNQFQSTSEEKENSAEHTEMPNIDMDTLLKMKKIMDAMNVNKEDPRTNLLLSLKPYLKESRQKKVEEYIKLFGVTKAFELFNHLGGENKNDV